MDKMFGALREALALPDENADIVKMPAEALKGYAAKHPGNYQAQMLLGEALRKAGDSTRRCRRSSAPPRSRRWRTATTARTRRWPQIALEKKDKRARDRRAEGADGSRLRQRRGRAPARRTAEAKKTSPIPRSSARLPAHCRDRPVRRRCPATLGRLAMQRNDPTPRRASSGRARAEAGRSGERAHRSRRELFQERQTDRSQAGRRSPRSKSRRATSARRTCC